MLEDVSGYAMWCAVFRCGIWKRIRWEGVYGVVVYPGEEVFVVSWVGRGVRE